MWFLKHRSPLSVFALISLLAACGGGSPAPASVDPQEQYAAAVADARTALPSEISRYLTPINAQNPDLVWEDGVVGLRLLVGTWLDDAGKYYKCSVSGGCSGNTTCIEGGECPIYKYDSWVTVAPELRNIFATTQPEPLRIAQLLGMPPETVIAGHPKESKYMLEMWVAPKDLFRPCPDTEISDSACEIDFPADLFRTPDLTNLVRTTTGPDYGVFMTYPDWFSNRSRYIYTLGSDPYPWTRLS